MMGRRTLQGPATLIIIALSVVFAACDRDRDQDPSTAVAFDVEASQEVATMLREQLDGSNADMLESGSHSATFAEAGRVQGQLLADSRRLDVGLIGAQLVQDADVDSDTQDRLLDFYQSYLNGESSSPPNDEGRIEAAEQLGDFELTLLAMAVDVYIVPDDGRAIAEAMDRGLREADGFEGIDWLIEGRPDVDQRIGIIQNRMDVAASSPAAGLEG